MPRTTTVAELALLQGTKYSPATQVWIADATGTLRDYTAQGGHNFVQSWQITSDIDTPVSQATIVLTREITDNSGTYSLSPFLDASPLNALGPAIAPNRLVRILVATTAVTVPPTAPVSGDWKNLFEGYTDSFSAGGGTTLTVVARDLGGQLTKRYVKTETQYGASDGSVVLEDVIQSILTSYSRGPVTLYVPTPSAFAINPYKQPLVSIADAVATLDGLIGWDTRYVWDDGTSAWRYTLYQPPRGKTTPDRTLSPSRILAWTKLDLTGLDVRNDIDVWYTDVSTGLRTPVNATDATSVTAYDDQWMRADEASDSPIDTSTEAQAFADLMLGDLKDPKADQVIEMHLDWSIALHDLITFTANGVHYDADQHFAVVGLTHSYATGKYRTQIATRGTVCGRFNGWLQRGNDPSSSPSSSGPTLIVTVDSPIATDSITVRLQNTGVLTLSTDGGQTFAGTLPSAFPWVIPRPDSTAGLTDLHYVFRASLNGASVTHPVTIPATAAPSVPATPPDHVYVTSVAVSDTVTVHHGGTDLIVLTAMPAARTASFHPGKQFGLDATPFGSARLIVTVTTAGSAGSVVALEYFDVGTSTWLHAGSTDITAPLDALGTHVATGQNLVAGVTGPVLLRCVTQGGNGVATPEVGYLGVSFTEALPSGAPAPVVTPPTKLMLRNTVPSSAPAGNTFPRSSSMPVDNVRLSTGYDSPRGMVQTAGTETSTGARHLAYVGSSVTGTHDGFAAVFLSEPFTAGQVIPAGNWEFGAVGVKWATPANAVPQMALYVLRNSGGTWSKVGTIYDVHEGMSGAADLMYSSRRVIKKVVAGASITVLTGDVLAFEPWMHVVRLSGSYVQGGADAIADIYHDGATVIPVGATDGGIYTNVGTTIPAAYLLAPCALNVL